MGQHDHGDPSWPVRIDDTTGVFRGSGVLLDDRHVLTCAHVVADAGAGPAGSVRQVQVRSLACKEEWLRTARPAPQVRPYEPGSPHPDVALLRLDRPVDCGITTALLRTPISEGIVRAYGCASYDMATLPVDAELGGEGGPRQDLHLLKRLAANTPWIRGGYSGAGVVMRDGEFKGRLIGIVVADYRGTDARAAWLLPTESVEPYLDTYRGDFVEGARGNRMADPAVMARPDTLHDTLRLALTRELAGLLAGDWSGTVVVRTGGPAETGSSWLVRLVGTADPASRAAASDAAFTRAERGTVLGLGAIDAAYDARGRSVAEVRDYLAHRFGLGPGDSREVGRRLLRRRPPATVVIDGVDECLDPDGLTHDLLGLPAAGAALRGMRLVLGFDGGPPRGLVHDVLLDPGPVTAAVPAPDAAPAGAAPEPMDAAEARSALRALDAAEAEVTRLYKKWGGVFRHPGRPGPAVAPRLWVRLAVARATGPNLELAAVHEHATAAALDAGRYREALLRRVERRADLLATLELYRDRGARHLGEEDLGLAEPYARASEALHTAPISLTRAARLVDAYLRQVNARVDGTRPRDDEG